MISLVLKHAIVSSWREGTRYCYQFQDHFLPRKRYYFPEKPLAHLMTRHRKSRHIPAYVTSFSNSIDIKIIMRCRECWNQITREIYLFYLKFRDLNHNRDLEICRNDINASRLVYKAIVVHFSVVSRSASDIEKMKFRSCRIECRKGKSTFPSYTR